MKIARYQSSAGPERLGIVTAASGREHLIDVAKAAAVRGGPATPTSVMALIEGGAAAMDATRELLRWAADRQDPLWMDDPNTVEWLTPVPEKSIFCAGRNFGRHKLESMKGNADNASSSRRFIMAAQLPAARARRWAWRRS